MNLEEQTERVIEMVEVVAELPPGERRRKMSKILLQRAADLQAATQVFADLLDAHWQACNDQPDHPKAAKREEMVLVELREYVAAYDATLRALAVQGGPDV